jgi:hypothetical protein
MARSAGLWIIAIAIATLALVHEPAIPAPFQIIDPTVFAQKGPAGLPA